MDKDSNGTVATAASDLCVKCGVEPKAKGHKWCNKCKAEAQKTYDADRDAGLEERGFKRGCEAMREELLAGLRKAHPAGMLRNHEVMQWIADTPAPALKA